MRLKLSHRTSYGFDTAPSYGLQQLRLTPQNTPAQSVQDWQMQVAGGTVECSYLDHNQNLVTLISFSPDAQAVEVTCTGEMETNEVAGVHGAHRGLVPLWVFLQPSDLTRASNGTRKLTAGLRDAKLSDIERLHTLSARILEAVPYAIGPTHAGSSAEEAIEAGSGVCQDHTHIFISAARLLGYPARYVSGYLMMEDRIHQDASHAWAEAHIEGLGWVGFDVSNGISPDTRYVRVASGIDYREVAPIIGLRYGAGDERLSVDIQVQQQ